MFNIGTYHAKKNVKDRCTRKGTQDYLANRRCFSDSLNVQHDCMDKLIADGKSITRIPLHDLDLMLLFACW